MRILVACEHSGTVKSAFAEKGHDVTSCDLKPCEIDPSTHHEGDVTPLLDQDWDMIIAHPECTYMTNSGVCWLYRDCKATTVSERWELLNEATEFFSLFLNHKCPRICIENPIMHKHAKKRITNYVEPAQIIQPWHHGSPHFKATCLWLKGLTPLQDSNRLIPPKKGTEEYKDWSKLHLLPPGPKRAEQRSRTFPEIAQSMVKQWG